MVDGKLKTYRLHTISDSRFLKIANFCLRVLEIWNFSLKRTKCPKNEDSENGVTVSALLHIHDVQVKGTQYNLTVKPVVRPEQVSSRTSFSLEFGLGIVSIYLHPLVWAICLCKQTSQTSGCK